MVLPPDHDAVTVPDAWGSFQKAGALCVLHIGRPCGGWGLDLGQMTHPNSEFVSRVQGILVLTLVLLLFQIRGFDLGLVVHRVLEMCACANMFCSCLEWTETKYCGRDIKALLTQSYVYLLSNCFVSTSNQSSLRVMWNTSTAALILGFCFTIRADGFTILWSKIGFFFSFMFSLTYKVAVNLLSLHMAFYSSCDLLHNLMQLYSNWLPAYFFIRSPIYQSRLPEAVGCGGLDVSVYLNSVAHFYVFTLHLLLQPCQMSSRNPLCLLW